MSVVQLWPVAAQSLHAAPRMPHAELLSFMHVEPLQHPVAHVMRLQLPVPPLDAPEEEEPPLDVPEEVPLDVPEDEPLLDEPLPDAVPPAQSPD